MSKKEFTITSFTNYRKIEGQYSDEYIKNSLCVKISENKDTVKIAVSERKLKKAKELESVHFPKKVIYNVVEDKSFAEFIGSIVEKETIQNRTNESKSEELYNLENISSDAPAINIINSICLEAIRKQASDIHIQNTENGINVRFRIDGVLKTVKTLDTKLFNNLVSRIKVLSGLNVMENRLPQDGRMHVSLGKTKIDLRVSIVPVTTGQSVVMRLFNNKNEVVKLENLGFTEAVYKTIDKSLHIPYGLILATGPTGSGKTTTLHAMLEKMDKEHLKITTIEDPVERELAGIDQIQVNEEIGLTFESILRRILRQDPDVIMVGEIRDKETAELAIRAALTGHVILSTLHTNDSVSAITRLKDLGVEPYLIASVLKYCLAQRLVRKICKTCKGKGCEECNFTGYKERTAVSEIFEVNKDIEDMITNNKTDIQIRERLLKDGFKNLHDDAKFKLKSKITSTEELKREALI